MEEKILHLTTKTRDLTWEEEHLLKCNRRVLKDWEIRFHDDKDNEEMVKSYFPEYLEKYNSIPKGVAKADIARVMYMYIWGGGYADTDYIWYKDPSQIKEFADYNVIIPTSREAESESGLRYGNAIFLSAPKQQIWLDFLLYIFSSSELSDLAENRIEKVTGSEGFTAFLYEVGIENIDKKYDKVWSAPRDVFHPYRRKPEPIGRHYCWGSWRTKSYIVNAKTWLSRKMQALLRL